MALPDHLSFLLDARAYSHSVQEIHLVETHISWILLTG
jgi:aminoglycoside phosphotransferase family enzyme